MASFASIMQTIESSGWSSDECWDDGDWYDNAAEDPWMLSDPWSQSRTAAADEWQWQSEEKYERDKSGNETWSWTGQRPATWHEDESWSEDCYWGGDRSHDADWRRQCLDEGRCFKCGEKGHMAAECPQIETSDDTEPQQYHVEAVIPGQRATSHHSGYYVDAEGTAITRASQRRARTRRVAALRALADAKPVITVNVEKAQHMATQIDDLRSQQSEVKEMLVSLLAATDHNMMTLASVQFQQGKSFDGVIDHIQSFKASANISISKLYNALDAIDTRLKTANAKVDHVMKEVPCKFFAQASCVHGDSCRFAHVVAAETAPPTVGKGKGKGMSKGKGKSWVEQGCPQLFSGPPLETAPLPPGVKTHPEKAFSFYDAGGTIAAHDLDKAVQAVTGLKPTAKEVSKLVDACGSGGDRLSYAEFDKALSWFKEAVEVKRRIPPAAPPMTPVRIWRPLVASPSSPIRVDTRSLFGDIPR